VIDYEHLPETIIRIVNNNQGLKGTELVLKLMSADLNIEATTLLKAIDEVVQDGEIIEVEYTLPTMNSMNYRVKSMYFPKGTVIKIKYE